MPRSSAGVVWSDADAMRAEGRASGGFVACSGASVAGDVFYLIAGEAFVEVSGVTVEVQNCVGGHAYVDEEGGEGESSDVGEVVSCGESGV